MMKFLAYRSVMIAWFQASHIVRRMQYRLGGRFEKRPYRGIIRDICASINRIDCNYHVNMVGHYDIVAYFDIGKMA